MNYIISASMACANPLCIREDFDQLEESSLDAYHFDFCDGVFAPTFLMNSATVRAMRPKSRKRFDVHLYCHHPMLYLEDLKDCGSDVVIVHLESAGDDYRTAVRCIRELGMLAGIAILPTTSVPENVGEILPLVSLIITNTVGPAYAGQPFNPAGLENMRVLAQKAHAMDLNEIEIAADGSVSAARLPSFLEAGCNHFICGTSSVFKPGLNRAEGVEQFRKDVESVLLKRGE